MNEKEILRQEKVLLDQLNKDREAGDFVKIWNDYKQLIQLIPQKTNYWIDTCYFIHTFYKYAENDKWDYYLNEGKSLAIKAQRFTTPKINSLFIVYEYKFVLELIRLDGKLYSSLYTSFDLHSILDKAININPKNDEAHYLKANLFISDMKFEKAELEFEKIYNTESPVVLFDIGTNYHQLKNDNKAVQIFLKIYENSDDSFFKEQSIKQLIEIYKEKNENKIVSHYTKILKTIK